MIPDQNMWLEILKNQGIPTFLILVIVAIFVVYVIPEWKKHNDARLKQEAAWQESTSKQHDDLVQQIRDMNDEHRKERADIARAHREDMREERKAYQEMNQVLERSLGKLGREVSRNTAITLASAVEMGVDKRAIKDRAERLETNSEADLEAVR